MLRLQTLACSLKACQQLPLRFKCGSLGFTQCRTLCRQLRCDLECFVDFFDACGLRLIMRLCEGGTARTVARRRVDCAPDARAQFCGGGGPFIATTRYQTSVKTAQRLQIVVVVHARGIYC